MANFAQLGIQINSDSATQAAADLDKLTAAGKRAEQATDKLSQGARRSAASIQEERDELSKLLGTIDPTVAALGRLDAQERKLAQFRRSGALDTDTYTQYNNQIQNQRNQLAGLADTQRGVGKTSKEMSFALRGLPAQFTDIAVSLQGGQAPLTVFLQQGGQLKDMFGGIGPAARAMGGYIAGLINPFTIAAAAIGGIAIAASSANADMLAFNTALITTGGYADVTAGQLRDMSESISGIGTVTSGQAIAALTAVANTGKFTGEQLDVVATAAARMENATGQAVDTTVAKFLEIQKDPVNALLKLNETENFLNRTQLERIQTLIEEGRQAEAAAEAVRIYGDRVTDVANAVEAATPHMTRMWKEVKDGISGAWNEAKGFSEFLAAGAMQQSQQSFGQRVLGALSPVAGIRNFAQGLYGAQPAAPAQIPTVAGGAVDSRAERERIDALKKFNDEASRYYDDAKKKSEELKAVDDLLTKGIINQTQAAERRGQIEESYARKGARSTRERTNADESRARTLIESAQRQVQANTEQAESGEKVTASRRMEIQIDQLLEREKSKLTAATRANLEAMKAELAASDALAKAKQQENRDLAANVALRERLAAESTQQGRSNEAALMGIGRGDEAAEIANRQIGIWQNYYDSLDRLNKDQRDKDKALSAEEFASQESALKEHLDRQLATESAYQERRAASQGDWTNGANRAMENYMAKAADVAGQVEDIFDNAFQGMEDSLVEFMTTGKLSFSDLINTLYQDISRFFARQLIANFMKSFMSGMGGGEGGGWASAIGSLFGQGRAGGGYTGYGGKYQPAGIVHKGEVVWNQDDVRAAGGPRAANAMRPTSGYAGGGIVGMNSIAARSGFGNNQDTNTRRETGGMDMQVVNNFSFAAPTNQKTQTQISAQVGYEISRTRRLGMA